jgi:hypothetical protein
LSSRWASSLLEGAQSAQAEEGTVWVASSVVRLEREDRWNIVVTRLSKDSVRTHHLRLVEQ